MTVSAAAVVLHEAATQDPEVTKVKGDPKLILYSMVLLIFMGIKIPSLIYFSHYRGFDHLPGLGKVPMNLQIIPSMTSSAPPPMLLSLKSL